jgi:predicted AAA+ superfamily ATPase
MALSNRDRIDRGLEAVTRGLGPYVLRELKSRYGDRWSYAVASELDGGSYSRIRQSTGSEDGFLRAVDAQALFKLMWGTYNEVFKEKLGFSGRNYLSEIMEVRNEWAHGGAFTADQTARALDTMHLLLRATSAAPEAEEVQKHQRAVMREIFEADQRREVKRVTREIPQTQGGLLPWRRVVDPHPDVREGRFQEAEFAADLAEVLNGNAEPEYQDPKEFFRRTYLTQGMVALLGGSIRRATGNGGDPVVQLQTVFGGGKTHTMLALYHLFGGEVSLGEIPDGEKVEEAAETSDLPTARRAVLVGTDLDVNRPRRHPDITTRTLWGEMAYQLGGTEGYELVAGADQNGKAPGAATLKQLFDEFGPALVLVDELVAYVRNIYGNDDLPAGSFDANMTFVQNLTEAAKRSERSLVVVSIPVSERAEESGRSDIEVGGEIGKLVAERLEQVIGRLESVWKPVGATEGFEIVRRRLFSSEMNEPARNAVVSAFARMYRDNRSDYPSECFEGEYERRLRSAYPIHPELFDRLYQDWSTLEKFQRTRGVLRLMAAVIHELWNQGDASLMIMPGSIPFDEYRVRNQFVRYLPEGWDAVVDTDVDGPDSRPEALDRQVGSLGRYAAARRVARAVFVGSAPSVAGQSVRGVEEVRVRLGCVQPGEPAAVFGDALSRLSDQAAYLYSDGTRHWYDTRPNVNREAADRAQQQRHEDVIDEIVSRLRRAARDSGEFARVHVAPGSGYDVSDDMETRLVVLGPEVPYRQSDPEDPARKEGRKILDYRGSAPRQYRNMLVFLAPDRSKMETLEQTTSRYLAWKSILRDEEQLNLDAHGRRQARENQERFDDAVDLQLEEAYAWLLYPSQEPREDGKMGDLEWNAVRASLGGGSLVERASRKVVTDGALVTSWSPVMLKNELDKYLWRGGEHVQLKQVWEDLAKYLYLPRVRDEEVLKATVREGVKSEDYFGYATSVTASGRYEGLKFGDPDTTIYLDEESVLIRPDVARRQIEEDEKKRGADPGVVTPGGKVEGVDNGEPGGGTGISGIGGPVMVPEPPVELPRRFYGVVEVNPVKLGGSAGQISQEVVQHLASIMGSNVEITVEIKVDVPEGIPEHVERIVSENCRTLRFKDFRFERE